MNSSKGSADSLVPISWFTMLQPGWICMGPKLKGAAKEVEYLALELGVTHVVSLFVFEDDKKEQAYAQRLRGMQFLSAPLDMSTYKARGRVTKEQNAHLALHYARHAHGIFKELPESLDGTFLYVHQRSGFNEETYIAFALWEMMLPMSMRADEERKPPSEWIKENDYDYLLDEDVEALALLDLVCEKALELRGADKFFQPRKKPCL